MTTKEIIDEFAKLIVSDNEYTLNEMKKMLEGVYKSKSEKVKNCYFIFVYSFIKVYEHLQPYFLIFVNMPYENDKGLLYIIFILDITKELIIIMYII